MTDNPQRASDPREALIDAARKRVRDGIDGQVGRDVGVSDDERMIRALANELERALQSPTPVGWKTATLVKQRGEMDCAIACMAMHTGRPYEEVLEAVADYYHPEQGLWRTRQAWARLGVECHVLICPGDGLNPSHWREAFWGRRVMFSVPSLNHEGGRHFVYHDGRSLFDPCLGKTYAAWDQLLPDEATIFEEFAAPQAPPSEEGWRDKDELREMLKRAYEQGCLDVHNNYQEDSDPDFSEAGYDYAASVLPAPPAPVLSDAGEGK